MKLEYKVATKEHKDFIFNECIELVKKYEDLTKIDINKIIKFEQQKIEQNIQQYTAVYDDGTFIGIYKLTKENEYYELDDLYIVEKYRNKGYGSKILKECIKYTPIVLYVFKNNTIAFNLYAQYGFEILEDFNTRVKMIRRNNYLIRNSKYEDIEFIVDVTIKSWKQTYKGLINDEYLDSMNREELIEIQRNKYSNNNCYVLEVDNKIVGFIRFGEYEKDKSKGTIYALYILEDYKGFGYGKKLLNSAFNKLKRDGYNEVIIGCLVGNKSNEFYKHLGGKLIGSTNSSLNGLELKENLYVFII